jgi:O-antigen/teichoic acid export membrane protein
MEQPTETSPNKGVSVSRSVARNTLFLVIADIANKAMTLVFFLVAARRLMPDRYGVFSFAVDFVTMFAILTDLGLGMLTTREVAKDRGQASEYVSNALTLKLFASLLVVGIVLVSVRLGHYSHSIVQAVTISSGLVLPSTIFLYIGNVFLGFERNEYTAVGRVLQTVLMTAGAMLLAGRSASASSFCWLYILASGAATVYAFVVLSVRFVRPRLSLDPAALRRMLKAAWPFAASAVLVTLYYLNSSIFLSKLGGERAVGVYKAAFRLALGIGFPAAAFAGAMYPLMSRSFVARNERLGATVTRASKYMLYLGIGIAVLGLVLAKPAVDVIYGHDYQSCIVPLRLLLIWSGCTFANALLSNYFCAIDRQRSATRQALLSLLVNLALNALLIGRAGATGAAVALLTAEIAGTIFYAAQQLDGRLRISFSGLWLSVARAVSAAAVALPVVVVAGRCHPVAALAAGPALYVISLTALRGFDGQDLGLIRSVFNRHHV